MRYLIINADDYGVCTETNSAIEHIFNEGTVSSTTVMVPCPGAEDAVARAKSNPRISMGLHFTTNAEWKEKWGQWKPISPNVPSLTAENGYFFSTVPEFLGKAKAEEVAIEMEAQYQFLAERGILPTHMDSHMGSVYGLHGASFMKETLEFCAKYKLPFRFPKSLENVKRIAHLNTIPPSLAEAHQQAVAYADALGVKLIDNLLSNFADFSEMTEYRFLKDAYFNIISHLPEGVTDIFLHPSSEKSPIGVGNPKWAVRVWEYQLLLDDDLKLHLEKEGVKLITYSEIP